MVGRLSRDFVISMVAAAVGFYVGERDWAPRGVQQGQVGRYRQGQGGDQRMEND